MHGSVSPPGQRGWPMHHPRGPAGWHGPVPHAPWMRPPRWAALWLPVIIAFLAQVPLALLRLRASFGFEGPFGGIVTASPAEALVSLGLAILGPALLIGARRFPGPVVALVALAASLDLFIGDHAGPPYVALAFALVGAIVRGARVWAWASIAISWVATIAIAIALGFEQWTPGRIAGTTLGILILLGIGESIRTRLERAREFERLARQREQSEVQAERVRIARELHDVLAHSLSQINVQAGVGLHLMERQPDKAADALASIKETSKTALDEVRAVLGILRAEGGADPAAPLVPEPDLGRLAGLVAAVSAGGLEVGLDDALAHDEVPKPLQLAIYRIVQESLTNVQRHAPEARTVRVTLARAGDRILLDVLDDGPAATGPASETGGRGLLGMRERAELLGGHLTAGPAPTGGFRVAAELPFAASPDPEDS